MSSLRGRARSGARTIRRAYEDYRREFQAVTRKARRRFEQRDWAGGQRDALERLELYLRSIEIAVGNVEQALGDSLFDTAVWRAMKEDYSESISEYPDVEQAETFFNSVTRKVFVTVGVDPVIEYVDLDPRRDRYGHGYDVHRSFARGSTTAEVVARALAAQRLAVPFRDAGEDARLAAKEIDEAWRRTDPPGEIEAIDLIRPVFFRGTGAYLVGRVRGSGATLPLVLVLLNRDGGLEVDAVLASEREVSIVFSFTRSHFQVDVTRPADVIRFLASIMPRKPLAELYIALGYTKHGKTELYRDLMGHLRRSMDRFDHAPGQPGMVMIVFTQRSYGYVFKVIRDEFAPPKTNTRQDVVDRYQLVFRHDRAGRLIEAQEFEHLIFDVDRFEPALLEELSTAASGTVTVDGRNVHIRHLYLERRVQPLDLYLRESDGEAADRAVEDYGQAIRDLATTNIFPGDLLLKNFGVTRHGRVTFYDYDELRLVTDCVFRDLPTPRTADEELAAEPWFYVGENDVFPQEFLSFMGLGARHRRVFISRHGDTLTADFWRDLQRRHRAGEVTDVFPYPESKRLRRGATHS